MVRAVETAQVTGQWGELLSLVEQRWESLLESSLQDAHLILRDVPAEWFVSFPRAMLIARIVVPGRDFPNEAPVNLGQDPTLADSTLVLVDRRLRGDAGRASTLALEAEPAANAMMVHEHLVPAQGVRSYFMQAGVSHLLAGRFTDAQRCLIRVSGTAGEGEHVGQRRDALGKSAFAASLAGDMRRARGLIDEAAGLPKRVG